MRARRLWTLLLVPAFALVACEQPTATDGVAPTDGGPAAARGGNPGPPGGAGGPTGCRPTGTGLTAKVVNKDVIGKTIDIGDCDVGAFFDEDGTVRNATFVQLDSDPEPTTQFLVRVEGAEVDVDKSRFDVAPDYRHQIIHVAYTDGASGQVTQNRLRGFKRAGILLRGAGTSAVVRKNRLAGVGPKTTGWAENGIQVDGGASGTVIDNKIVDHWWDNGDFVSSGVIVVGADGVVVEDNNLSGNDLGIAFVGDDNEARGNRVAVQQQRAQYDGFPGVFVFSGTDNSVVGNVLRSKPTRPASFGVLDLGAATTVTDNIINGFSAAVSSSNTVSGNVLTPAASRSPNH